MAAAFWGVVFRSRRAGIVTPRPCSDLSTRGQDVRAPMIDFGPRTLHFGLTMVSAIIVAAGRGTRMGPNIDKLFLEVAGRPVIAHTWACFNHAACVDEIVLVV